MECLSLLTNSVQTLQEQGISSSSSKLYLCKSTLPVLIGLARAVGRFCAPDPPLFCRLFPRPEPPIITHQNNNDKPIIYKKSFSNFRPIIPRSLSGNLTAALDILAITQVSVKTFVCCFIGFV